MSRTLELLEHLARLKDDGILSEEEFQSEKDKLLAGGEPPQTLPTRRQPAHKREWLKTLTIGFSVAVVLIILGAVLWIPVHPEVTPSASLTNTLTPPQSSTPRVASSVRGIRIATLTELPVVRPRTVIPEYCATRHTTPTTSVGRFVSQRGWHVTSEGSLGAYEAVAFVRTFEPGTSGVCSPVDGNVAIFRGGALIAIVYASGDTRSSIGRLQSFPNIPFLRIWDGTGISPPLADLRLDSAGIVVGRVAAFDVVCGGGARVPNIFGQPIERARVALRRAGWRPVNAGVSDEPGGREGELRANGIVEAEACAGTGYGQCTFNYDDARDNSLRVITVGDVVDYETTCN